MPLDKNDTQFVIQELYQGSNKKFEFDSNEPINQHLFDIYENFIENEKSDFILRFSNINCKRPFVSLKKFDSPNHILNCVDCMVYVYE